MNGKQFLALGLAASACMTMSTAASAEGKTDRARKAIAAAQAKIDAANIVGAAGDAPRLHAQAVSTLHTAQDELNHHAKDDAFRDATRASELADQALAASQSERNAAQQAATADAQRQAEDANSRAASAQAAAAAATADAAAARSAPPVIVQTPAPAPAPAAETTVTTTSTDQAATPATTVAPIRKRVVRRKATSHARPATHRTTTTVTTR